MSTVTRHLRLIGRVQGVGFRFYVVRQARELGITGWVRNRRDGSVEAVAQGLPEAVERFIAAARRGPPGALVSDLELTEGSGDYADFGVKPTD